MGFIYKITNKSNGKFYLGSTKNVKQRWKTHRYNLKNNKHHSLHLQQAWNKYGEDNFVFDIIQTVDDSILLLTEQNLLDTLKPYDNSIGYNMAKNSSGGDLISYHPNIAEIKEKQKINTSERWKAKTEDEKLQFSEKMKGDKNPNWLNGKTFKECPICKLQYRSTNKVKTCKKCRDRSGDKNPFFGKHHSQETKDKLREYNKSWSEEIKEKRKNIMRKVVLSRCKIPIVYDIEYMSIGECSKILNIHANTLRYRLDRPEKFKNYKWKNI